MSRTRRQELIWLILIGGCVALFVAHHERAHTGPGGVAAYDTRGLNALVRESMGASPARADDDLVTGSIRPKPRPAGGSDRYYVPLGSYASVDAATRRYLEFVHRTPALDRDGKLRIETVSLQGDRFYRVRMGDFGSLREARSACSRAGLTASSCSAVGIR